MACSQTVTKQVALLAAIVGTVAVAPTASAATSRTIASAATADFRAALVAHPTSGGATPSAAVTLVTYRRVTGGWHRMAGKRVAGTYFWKTITAPRAVCRFELASAGRAHVVAQLLVSASIGCGKATTVTLPAR
ncbi:MAG: hypothetical protein ACRDL2_15985 [Gaiellaceae bacterium]